MAISFVGAATGTTSATLPAHAAGDVLLAFAHRDGNTTAPSLPAGWTDLGSGGANVNSSRIGYKVAASSSETSGTWTNATGLVVLVYRGCVAADPIGAVVAGGSSSLIVAYPALTLENSTGSSWVVGVAGHRSVDIVGLNGPPSGLTNRAYLQDATATLVGHDTAAGVSSWAGASDTVTGTSAGWRSWSVELLAAAESGESASGGSSSLVSVTSAGAGSAAEAASGGASSVVGVTAAGAGSAAERAAGGAGSVVNVTAAGAGSAQEAGAASGGSSSVVSVTSAGAGTKQEEGAQQGGSASVVSVTSAGSGIAREAASGGSASLIRVLASGSGVADDGTQIVLPPVRCVGSHALAASITAARSAAACAGSHRAAASVTTTVRPIP